MNEAINNRSIAGLPRLWKLVEHRLGFVLRIFQAMNAFEAALYLTLLILILERSDIHSLVLFSAIGIIVRPLIRHKMFWLCLTTLFVLVIWQPWFNVPNHRYFQAYWCLAITLSLFTASPEESLAKSARWLVGLAFLFSLIWKLRTPEFIDGRFFEYSIIYDVRLVPLAVLLGIDSDLLAQNRELLRAFISVGNLSGEVVLETNRWVAVASTILTWWTLLIEALVAACFLLSSRWISDVWRHSLLLVFIFTTYLLAPVVGFGWALVAMGMSRVKLPNQALIMMLYTAGFVLVFLGRNPGLQKVIELIGF
jgi:hypothetical protein